MTISKTITLQSSHNNNEFEKIYIIIEQIYWMGMGSGNYSITIWFSPPAAGKIPDLSRSYKNRRDNYHTVIEQLQKYIVYNYIVD